MMDALLFISFIMMLLAIFSGFFMFWKSPIYNEKDILKRKSPSISVIIPARNEAKRIKPLLESLRMQKYNHLEIIVVDDDSTDKTKEIGLAYGAKVIERNDKEKEWVGKSASCWVGANAATANYFLFLDADTYLQSHTSLQRMMRIYQTTGSKGIVSFQPYHTIKHCYENLSAIFNVIVMVGMNAFTALGDKLEVAGAFGPCFICNKNDYFASGGHKKVGDAIMDDLALADEMKAIGLPVRCFSGKGLIQFRMYPEGIKSLLEGWTKNFATASKSTHWLVMTCISVWIAGGFTSIPFFVGAWMESTLVWVLVASLLTLIYLVQFIWLVRRTGNFYLIALLLYPFLFLFFTAVFLRSIYLTNVKHTVSWKGRKMKV